MKTGVKAALIAVAVTLVGIQFVPVRRTHRAGSGDPTAPRDVQWILRRACYDCHSTESRWPIWAYIAPMSWRVVADVDRARARLNFSDWTTYDRQQRMALRSVIGPITASHRMPLWYYMTLHPDARLSDSDLTALQRWSDSATAEGP